MPAIISCPDCARTVRVPDDLMGKKVRCPGCDVVFTAPAAPDTASGGPSRGPGPRLPERDVETATGPGPDDAPDKERLEDRLRRERVGWRRVSTGLALYGLAVWLWMGGLVALAFGTTCAMLLEGGGNVVFLIFGAVAGLCFFGDVVLRAIGSGFCLAVPARLQTAIKLFAITCFALYCGAGCLQLGGARAVLYRVGTLNRENLASAVSGSRGLSFFAAVIGFAGLIAFLVFCRLTAVRGRDKRLGRTFLALVIAFPVFIGVAAIVLSKWGADATQAPGSLEGVTGAAVIALFALLILAAAYMALQLWLVLSVLRLRLTLKDRRADLPRSFL